MTTATDQSIRTLLVDDHPVVRAGLRLAIEQDSRLCVVGEVGSGDGAERLSRDLAPDVVVMDINLPDTNGISATRAIKQQWPEVRVLIVSTYSDDEYVLGGFEAGADGYLLKQSPPEELRSGIERVAAGERVVHPSVVPALIRRATRPAPAPPCDALTEREREVLHFLADGATSKEIAVFLGLAPKTVENHRARILDKLGAANTAAAVRAALAQGLLEPAKRDAPNHRYA